MEMSIRFLFALHTSLVKRQTVAVQSEQSEVPSQAWCGCKTRRAEATGLSTSIFNLLATLEQHETS